MFKVELESTWVANHQLIKSPCLNDQFWSTLHNKSHIDSMDIYYILYIYHLIIDVQQELLSLWNIGAKIALT